MWITTAIVYPHYGNVSFNTQPISKNASTRYVYDTNRNVTTVNGTAKTFTLVTFDSGYSLTLLAINNAGSVDSRRAVGKLYSAQIYNNGIFVRNMIPVSRISDSSIGMYDLVNGKFYANVGTGTFVAGVEV